MIECLTTKIEQFAGRYKIEINAVRFTTKEPEFILVAAVR